ncbi:MAG TPA: hypothetical protein VMX55_13185 [candidate division Zixibacteria bacterium]|nr:hypothetical protein [candidate division Zixibacteria bacterium]
MEILEQINEEEIIRHELSIVVLLNLCELLLKEIHISEDQHVMEELQLLIDKLIEIATNQKSFLLLAETLWFKAQLVSINRNFQEVV